MSLSLAMSKIAEHTAGLSYIADQISATEGDAVKAAQGKDPAATKEVTSRMQLWKTLYGMIKDFIEFWKDVLKSILTLIKMMTELAQGAR